MKSSYKKGVDELFLEIARHLVVTKDSSESQRKKLSLNEKRPLCCS